MLRPGAWALAAVLGLAACQSATPTVLSTPPEVQKCADAAGFTARANTLRARGVRGDIIATPQEQAEMNACVKAAGQPAPVTAAKAAPVKAAPVATTAPARDFSAPAPDARQKTAVVPPVRLCRVTMIGGTGYACSMYR
ncbi:MAG: hypothetical protein WAK98_17410 [Gemmobacter sp.]